MTSKVNRHYSLVRFAIKEEEEYVIKSIVRKLFMLKKKYYYLYIIKCKRSYMLNPLDWGWNVSDDVMYPRMTDMAPAGKKVTSKVNRHYSLVRFAIKEEEEYVIKSIVRKLFMLKKKYYYLYIIKCKRSYMLNPLDWGWNVSDDVMYPRMTDMAPAPKNLLKMVKCYYKTDCSTAWTGLLICLWRVSRNSVLQLVHNTGRRLRRRTVVYDNYMTAYLVQIF